MAARLPGVLPSREDLGQLQVPRGRGVTRIDMDAVAAPGRGIASIGEGITSLAASFQQQADQDEEREVQRRLLEFEQAQSRDLDERRRTLSGDPSGFADTTRSSFTEAGRAMFADAQGGGLSQRALTRLAYGLSGLRDRFQTQAFSYELGQRGAHGETVITDRLNTLSQQYQQAQDDAERERILQDAERAVRQGRQAYGFSTEAETRLLGSARQMLEQGLLGSQDPYAALLQLREGDPRARTPSTGNVSPLGLSQIQRMFRRPGQTPEQAQADLQRLQTEATRISRWMQSNIVGEDGQRLSLTQLQHDALVGFALRQSREGGTPEDALGELLPSLQTGNWNSVASAIRAGSLGGLEQPGTPPPGGPQAPSGLGSISARYESGGRGVGFISSGQDDPGGQSYGIHQLSGASSMGAFLASPEGAPFRGEFGGTRPMTPEFNAIYRRIAERDPEGFAAAQRAFYTRTHYEPARQAAEQAGFDTSNRAVQEALFSIGVQHGGARTIIERAAGRLGANASVEDQIRALYEARTQYVRGLTTLPENTRQAVLSRYGREVQDVLALARDGAPTGGPPSTTAPDATLSEMGDMVTGQAPSSLLSRLPADRRRVLIRELSQALRTEAETGIESDIASIQATGQPRTLPDGTTWLQRAQRAGVFTPMQFARLSRRVREAEARWRAINGLSDMSTQEMADRLDDLDTSGVGEGEDYAQAGRVRQFAGRAIARIEQLRRTDPSLWASGTYMLGQPGQPRFTADGSIASTPAEDDLRVQPAREVMEAYQALARRYPGMQIQYNEQDGTFTATAAPAPGQLDPEQARPQTLLLTDPRLSPEDRRQIIEARLRAMARVGIAEGDRRILRADEARALLGLPSSLTGVDSTRYTQLLREAADRATTLFGPRYARLAFDTALGFRSGLSPEQRQTAQSFGGQLPGGGRDALTPSELSGLSRMSQLSREEALWRYGTPSIPLPGVGEGLPFGPLMGITAPPTPTPGWFGSTPSPEVPSALTFGASGSDVSEWPMALPPSMQGAPVSPPPPIAPQVRGSGAPGANLQGWPRPTPDLIARLARVPHLQAEFDRTFGPGATAHYLRIFQQSRAQ